MENEITTIQLKPDTRDRLKAYGSKGETYDNIITRLMNIYDRSLQQEESI